MSSDNMCKKFRGAISAAVMGLMAAMIVLTTCLGPKAYAKDNPDDFTRVYSHSYDEVWEATHEAIERLGWFATSDDKDKGIIRGRGGMCTNGKDTFEVRMETISPKPEIRATITVDMKCGAFGRGELRQRVASSLFAETQKVLATYK